MHIVSPPHSSVNTFFLLNSVRILSTSAFSLSILLIATIIGTFADNACSIASSVCGITPSSAATISTTISVIWAPRALIDENAACPGVSRKVILPFFVST